MRNRIFIFLVLIAISFSVRADMIGVNLYTLSQGGQGYIYQHEMQNDRGFKIAYYSAYNDWLAQQISFFDVAYKGAFGGYTFGDGLYWEVGATQYYPYMGLGYDKPVGPLYVNVGAVGVWGLLWGVNATAGFRF